MKTAIYPGTFDPLTYGHIDVIKKSLNVFDRLIVATSDNINKNYYFSVNNRLEIINNSLFKDLRFNRNKIKVASFDTLTINLCKKYNAGTIIRGLRAVSDFEYEFQLAGMNKKLNPKNIIAVCPAVYLEFCCSYPLCSEASLLLLRSIYKDAY